MKVISVIVLAFIGAALSNIADEDSLRSIQNYLDTLPEEEQTEVIQGFVDNVVESLIEEGDTQKLGELYSSLEKITEQEVGEQKRELTAAETHAENLKRGHCCLGGELTVSYATKTITVIAVNKIATNTSSSSSRCGSFGWRRCSSTKHTQKAVYEHKSVDLKVPLFTCHKDRAVCCHGYVEIKKLPGDLGQLGENNCIKSSQALFTIWNLQLFERVSEGKITLTESHMDKVLLTVEKFFAANGIDV